TPEPIIPRGEALSGWKSAVRPYWDALVGYARRFSQVKEREQQIQRDAATISAARTAQARPVLPEIEEIKRRRDRAQDQR
ncbi:hypothetical protein AB9K35_22075, partial [Leisingera sp. XS_AS12]|uniref:hypothetical protein n=1 Tax=Leisingera sp. XS_AS12 TaxID=3241294 RepID=UPI003512A647